MITLFVGGVAFAEGEATKDPTAAPGIDKRVLRQKKRISNKVKSGKITQAEADQLNKKVDEVEAKKAEMKKDGKLTKAERKELHQQLKKSSDEIKETGAKAEAPAGH